MLRARGRATNKDLNASPRPARTQGSFVLSPDFARQIIQDGGSTIDRDSATISAQKIEGLWTVYVGGYSQIGLILYIKRWFLLVSEC